MLKNTPYPHLFAAFAFLFALGGPAHAAEIYKIDPLHTAVVWRVSHFGFSSPSGKFMNIEGTVELDEKKPTKSKVSVTIPLASVNSGVAELDQHLRGKDFFEVETYPTATFVSDRVVMKGKQTANVFGTLTLHGVSRPVMLKVKLNKAGENMMKVQTAGFSASTKIKRSDFGITSYLPGLGDEVLIDIESEANIETKTSK